MFFYTLYIMQQIEIGKLLSDSWNAFYRNIVFYILCSILCIGVPFVVIPFGSLALHRFSSFFIPTSILLTISIIFIIVMFLIFGFGIKNCALISAKGGNVVWKHLFVSFKTYLKIILCWILIYLGVCFSMSFFVIPAIILMFLMQFVTIIIVENPTKCIVDAIRESSKLCIDNALITFLFSIIISFMASLAVCTVVGIFVVLPFQEVALATLYVRLREKENYPKPPVFYELHK